MKQKIINVIKIMTTLIVAGVFVFFTNVHFGREGYFNYIEDASLFLIIISLFIRKINLVHYFIFSMILLGVSTLLGMFSLQVISDIFSEVAYFVLIIILFKRLMLFKNENKS
jgi:hypothetical protein